MHILITGASKGIGFHTALELAQRGYQVSAVARSADRLKELENYHPKRIKAFPTDLTIPEQIKAIPEQIRYRGPLLSVIHNAATIINKKFEELSDADWYQLIENNLMASVRLYRSVLSLMASDSHIVSIGTMGGYMDSAKFAGLSGYSTTKGALTILSECIATEWKERGISSNCLCLGAVQTEMFQEAFPDQKAPVEPDQMGDFIADFATKGHRFFNGKVLPVAIQDP